MEKSKRRDSAPPVRVLRIQSLVVVSILGSGHTLNTFIQRLGCLLSDHAKRGVTASAAVLKFKQHPLKFTHTLPHQLPWLSLGVYILSSGHQRTRVVTSATLPRSFL